MGTIPRQLKKIHGFVESKFGPLPYEDEEDKEKLEVYAKVYDSAIARGKIIQKTGILPQFRGASVVEMKATQILAAHAIHNLENPVLKNFLKKRNK